MRDTESPRAGLSGTRARLAGCALLVAALGAGVTGCSSDGSPLSAEPYDAADQISFSGSLDEGKPADPDKPLEIVAEDSDGRITDVVAVDASGRHLAGELAADGSRWHSTTPLAASAQYTVRVSTENEDGRPGRKVLTFSTGFHGLHVTGGLIAFLLVLGRTYAARRFTHEQATAAIVVSYYWHFVDVVWIGLFATIYMIK
ncbi:Lipoprotein-anchoring transpeptidase ErfK/SrfK OS=Streptomyces albaduncus OX=68172 GN=FHS32_003347 PE=4 SV=1 [Streptomyces griseoloalbus]